MYVNNIFSFLKEYNEIQSIKNRVVQCTWQMAKNHSGQGCSFDVLTILANALHYSQAYMNTEQSADLSDICIICMSIRITNNWYSKFDRVQSTRE